MKPTCQQFGRIMQEYKRQMEWESLIVLDSGFYSQENLQMSQNLAWVSRVPLTITAAVALVQEISEEEYQVQGVMSLSEEKVRPQKTAAGRFMLATNVLDPEQLSSEAILSKYKGQQSVERGFRFLKDPMFLTDSVFVKSPRRVETLGFIMGLCLLVYSLGQRLLRGSLQHRQVKVSNQNGRPTERPT
jgi:transposase